MARFESLRIETDGATLAVRHYAGSGDPIVLLHAGPGIGDYFDVFPEVLSPPYRVVSYNQRGCGPSSCDGAFDVEKQVADLDAIRTHLGVGRIHIFGHSWGGLLGQLYAKAHPQQVASLVLCCSMGNTGSRVAAMESKGIAQRVMARPKRSPLAWVFAGTLMQFPGTLGDLGFGLVMKQLLPNYVVRPECGACRAISRSDERAHSQHRSLPVGGRAGHFFEDGSGFLRQGRLSRAGVTACSFFE